MNPLHEPTTTKWKEWGSAFHVLICEGEAKFRDQYYRGPAKRDFKNLLVTGDDLKRWLSARGLAVSGTKDKLIERAQGAEGDKPLIWDVIEANAQVLAGESRVILPPDDFYNIALSSKMITKNPECSVAFANGYPEVTIVWTDRYGTRLKCRLDYLRYRAAVDLKSFRNWRQMSMLKAIFNAIGNYRLDVQAAHYLEGRSRCADFIKQGKVFGDAPPGAWLDKLRDAPDWRFVWIFYSAEGAPIARRIEYEPLAAYHDVAMSEIHRALDSYRHYLEVFGTDIWVDVSEKYVLNNEDLPAYMGVG
jgi:hypothetical protein